MNSIFSKPLCVLLTLATTKTILFIHSKISASDTIKIKVLFNKLLDKIYKKASLIFYD